MSYISYYQNDRQNHFGRDAGLGAAGLGLGGLIGYTLGNRGPGYGPHHHGPDGPGGWGHEGPGRGHHHGPHGHGPHGYGGGPYDYYRQSPLGMCMSCLRL